MATTSLINKIHSLFVQDKGGTCIYYKTFSSHFEELQIDLITPFFSAILSFSESVVNRKLEVLEFGDLRFFFKMKEELIFIIFSDSTENLLFVSSALDKIIDAFILHLKKCNREENEVICSPELDSQIDMLIVGEDDVLQFKTNENYYKIIDFFMDLISDGDILGAALLTSKGATIYSSLSKEVFNRSMKELEIRYQTRAFDLQQHLYVLKNGKKVSERIFSFKNITDLLLIVEFPLATQLGLVDYYTEMMVEKVITLL